MAKRARYRWQARTERPPAPVTVTHGAGAIPRPWKKIIAKFDGSCSCGCGETVDAGEAVLWRPGEKRVIRLECAERLGVRPGDV